MPIPALVLHEKLSLILCIMHIINLKYAASLKFAEKRVTRIHWFMFHDKKFWKLKQLNVRFFQMTVILSILCLKGNSEPSLLQSIPVLQNSKYLVNFNPRHRKGSKDQVIDPWIDDICTKQEIKRNALCILCLSDASSKWKKKATDFSKTVVEKSIFQDSEKTTNGKREKKNKIKAATSFRVSFAFKIHWTATGKSITPGYHSVLFCIVWQSATGQHMNYNAFNIKVTFTKEVISTLESTLTQIEHISKTQPLVLWRQWAHHTWFLGGSLLTGWAPVWTHRYQGH